MSGLRGHLDLLAGADTDGRTILRRQSFSAPVHISKPHHDAGWLVVNMASPSPGLLAGDRVDVNVAVESGGRLLLTAPSASRIHAMETGCAEVVQHFVVKAGGFLDVFPEYIIPQARSTYGQKSYIEIEAGGCLLWTESIAPGRTAHGEVFEFCEMRIWTDIFHGGRHLVRERYRISGRQPGIHVIRKHFPAAYYASVVCVAPTIADDSAVLPEINAAFAPESVWVGASRLGQGAYVVKIVAPDSPTLRSVIQAVRTMLQAAAAIGSPTLRRITGENRG